jgi:hypothetical protein
LLAFSGNSKRAAVSLNPRRFDLSLRREAAGV